LKPEAPDRRFLDAGNFDDDIILHLDCDVLIKGRKRSEIAQFREVTAS
jgi:hypothetical protein